MTLTTPALSVLQLTDMHFLLHAGDTMLGVDTEKYFAAVLEHAFQNDQHYDVVLLTGDLVQDPCIASYERLRAYLLALEVPVLCLPGNHDDFSLMQTVLNTGNVACVQQRTFDHWQLICLNSQIEGEPGGYLSALTLNQLETALQNQPHHFAMIAVHHHCVAASSAWIDSMLIENSAEFLALLQKYPQVKVVVNGHIHQEQAKQFNQLQIYSTPSTCFQFTPESDQFKIDQLAPGYRTLSLYADGRVATEVHRLPNRIRELDLSGRGYFDSHEPR